MRSFGFTFFLFCLFSVCSQAQIKTDSLDREIEPSLDNLYYGNINEVITKILWFGEKNAIGLRYYGTVPKDLVLFDQQKLIVDSLSVNRMFLEEYEPGSGRFISINAFFQEADRSFAVVHNNGSTRVRLNGDRFELVEKKILSEKPTIAEQYLTGYRQIRLEKYSIGYRYDQSKYVTSADFWVYNWETGEHTVYHDSKFKEESNNRYWSRKNTPETYSTLTHFIYNITQTRDGFIFNLPLKNRFLKYSSVTGEIQGYTFPALDKKSQAWFAFYDWELDRVFPVLDTGKEYRIYSLNKEFKNFYLLASSEEQPFGVHGGKVYLRELKFKDKNKTWFCNHYLVDLYPKLK